MPSLIESTAEGLYCAEGDFHIDPWRPVARAVITHGHSDHARPGCASYLASLASVPILRARLGQGAVVQGHPLGAAHALTLGNVRLSLHPAGHITGSAQVRVQRIAPSPSGPAGETWVVTGDFKTTPDTQGTCEPFEPVACHTLITESTFALPVYRWPQATDVFAQINAWWSANAAMGRTTVVFAYALGKAQRLLMGLDRSIGPVGVHGAVLTMHQACAQAGVLLPEVLAVRNDTRPLLRGGGLIIAPPSTQATPWLRGLRGKEGLATAAASGWMAIRGGRRRQSLDRGFVLSDHADWPGLHDAIAATGATRVGVTHGFIEPMVRCLRERGLDAFAVASRFEGELSSSDASDPTDAADATDAREDAPPAPEAEP